MLGKKEALFSVAILSIVLIVSAGAVAASSHTDDGGETGELRVVHASPDAPNVDVYVDGDAVLENVSFGQVSDYLELSPGTYDIEVTAAGDSETSVFNEEIEVGNGSYTAVAIGEVSNRGDEPFSVEVLEDDNSQPPEGEARVRVVHASPDAPNVDVTAGGDALFEDVGFGGSGYVTVPEGNYTLQVRAAQEDNEGEVVDTLNLSAEAGSVYTAFAVGYVQPVGSPGDEPFDIIPTVDSESEESQESETATVSFGDQTTEGESVTIGSVSLPEGGFVAIHDTTLTTEDDPLGSTIGATGYLEPGEHEEVTAQLLEPIEEDQELIAMPHRDTNGNETLDFLTTNGSADGPYIAEEGGAVVDSAQVTVETMDDSDDGMEGNETDEGTDGNETDQGMDGNETDGGMEGNDSETDGNETDGEGDDGGQGMPGFTAIAALVALVGAALVARSAK